MMQRAGLAQALMNDPDLVVLDEPMSGLDPSGRKEVRDLISELRDQGKTVFFSSHILTDVESVADRVAIIARGQLQTEGPPSELVASTTISVDVTVRVAGLSDAVVTTLTERSPGKSRRVGDDFSISLAADADIDAWLAAARNDGARVVSVTPRHESLEIYSCGTSVPPINLRLRWRAGYEQGDERGNVAGGLSPSGNLGGGPLGSIGRVWAIALNTFREAARIRVLYGVVILVLMSNVLALVLGEMSIYEEQRVARDVGLAGFRSLVRLRRSSSACSCCTAKFNAHRALHCVQADSALGVCRR